MQPYQVHKLIMIINFTIIKNDSSGSSVLATFFNLISYPYFSRSCLRMTFLDFWGILFWLLFLTQMLRLWPPWLTTFKTPFVFCLFLEFCLMFCFSPIWIFLVQFSNDLTCGIFQILLILIPTWITVPPWILASDRLYVSNQIQVNHKVHALLYAMWIFSGVSPSKYFVRSTFNESDSVKKK